jgi:hypothetical protein
MSSKSILILTSVILALIFGIAMNADLKARRTYSRVSVLVANTVSLENEASRLESFIASAKREPAGQPPTRKMQSPTTVVAQPPPVNDPSVVVNALLKKDPALMALYLDSQRAKVGRSYGPLFQALQLSQNQIDRFEDLMAGHEAQMAALKAAAESQGLQSSDPATASSSKEADQQLAAAQLAVLGEVGYGQMQEYNRTLSVRTLVSQFAGTVAFIDPLTPQQGEQMVLALAQASPSYQNGEAADWQSVNYEQVARVIQNFLSDPQFAAWQQAEPMGGGPSRWIAQVQSRLKEADTPTPVPNAEANTAK